MADWFTNAELSAILDGNVAYTSDQLEDARADAQADIEDACGVTFTPQAFTEVIDGNGTAYLHLDAVPLLTVSAVTLDGADVLASATLDIDGGYLYRAAGWPFGARNVTVTGTAGYVAPPRPIVKAGRMLAKRYLTSTKISDRATSVSNADGVTEYLVVAGRGGAEFDVPYVNTVVRRYALGPGRMIY
jgi:hypothetical protein